MCGVGAELAPGDERARLRRARRAGRPAAHRSAHASVRAGAGARDAGRCADDRRRRARRDRRSRAGAGPLARALAATRAGRSRPPSAAPAAGSAASRRRKPRSRSLPTDGEPITMPFGDLTVSEGKIVRWVKTEGDGASGRRARRRDRDRQGGGRDRGARAPASSPHRAAGRRGGADGRADRKSCRQSLTRVRLHHVASGPAAIDRQRVAGDVGACGRGEEQRALGDLLRLTRSAERNMRHQAGGLATETAVFGVEQLSRDFSHGRARRDGVHADTPRRQFERHRAREVDHGGLGGNERALQAKRGDADGRGDIDDPADRAARPLPGSRRG